MKHSLATRISSSGRIAAAVAFLSAFGFFQFAYPYHLMRREQQTLFVYDWDYIRQTYRGSGWLARFVGDFLEQFFHLPVVGPLIVALILTAIGFVVYRICRHFLKEWPSLTIAAAVFLWSFSRESGNLFITQYSVAALGYLSLILAALQFRKAWLKPLAAVLLLAAGAWALGSPYHKYYGQLWGVPKFAYDKVIGLDTEVSRENWDKVLKLSQKDLYMVEASNCYNLAHAMKGDLGDALLNHSQSGPYDLLMQVSTSRAEFSNCLAGEAWFQLGEMTVAEQSAIIALQGSPKHTGARFIQRLARINLISGEEGAALKYLNLLSRTLFYGKWARSMMPGRQDTAALAQIEAARSRMPRIDMVHHSDTPRVNLLGLLEGDPDNSPARQFLLCYDLMRFDMDDFIEDYSRYPAKGHIFQEAVLLRLSQLEELSPENAAKYGVGTDMINKLNRFFRNPALYEDTYWYYFMDTLYESEQ